MLVKVKELSKIKHYKAPAFIPELSNSKKIFLAGAIDMGTAVEWQKEVVERAGGFIKKGGIPVPLFQFINPRRDDWDSNWKQSIKEEVFSTQVSWELHYLDKSDIVFFHFPKDSKAPISFFELGMVIATHRWKVVLSVEEGFYRMGNLEVIADKFGVPVYKNWEDAMKGLASKMQLSYNEKDESWKHEI